MKKWRITVLFKNGYNCKWYSDKFPLSTRGFTRIYTDTGVVNIMDDTYCYIQFDEVMKV